MFFIITSLTKILTSYEVCMGLTIFSAIAKLIDVEYNKPPRTFWRVYFNHPERVDGLRPDLLTRCDDIISFLNEAKVSLKICMFMMDAGPIIDAILNCHARNVRITIVTDAVHGFDTLPQRIKIEGINILCPRSPSTSLMHHKFVVVDDEQCLFGSINFTAAAISNNFENFIITNDPSVVDGFNDHFKDIIDCCEQECNCMEQNTVYSPW